MFYIGINCFPDNDKYKFKRLLVSLLVKPKFHNIELKTKLATNKNSLLIFESEFIRKNLSNVPNGSIFEMIDSLKDSFVLCNKFTSLVCVEFLVDGLHDIDETFKTIIDDFKKIHKNTIVSGTKFHTSLTVNRNIFLKNHKTDYVCFCDDDDLSCSIDTKYELFVIYLNYIYHKIQTNSKALLDEIKQDEKLKKTIQYITNTPRNLLTTEQIINITNKFRKSAFEFLKNLPTLNVKPKIIEKNGKTFEIKPYKFSTQLAKKMYFALSFFGPHFFTTYSDKYKSYGITYGFWSLIIPPWTIDNFTNVKEIKNEDIIYDVMHHLIRPTTSLTIIATNPIYIYLTAGKNGYNMETTKDNVASLGNAMMFGPDENFKFPNYGFSYDSIVEYCRNSKDSLEFVADRDFREYTIEDIKNFCGIDEWNKVFCKIPESF